MKKIFISLSLLSIIVCPMVAFGAQTSPIGCFSGTCAEGGTSIVDLLIKAVKWMYTLFFIAAVAYILWAAYIFLTSKGDKAKVEEGKKRLTYAVIAIVIALVASSVVSIVQSFLTS